MCLSFVPRCAGALLLVLAALQLSGADAPFLPPQTFMLTSGKPQQFSLPFALPQSARCDGKAAWSVRVTNDGVSSARLGLNGATIASEDDFRQQTFEVPIDPAVQNVLNVDLKGGRAGGSVTIAVHREIELPVASRTYTLTGGQDVFEDVHQITNPSSSFVITVRNGNGAAPARVKSGSVAINGIEVVSENELNTNAGFIRKPVAVTSNTTVTVTARGSGGEMLAVALQRIGDASACGTTVVFASPAAGETITTAVLHVTGQATGPKDSAVTVNGWRAELDTSRAGTVADPFTWFAEMPASPGAVALTAKLSSATGAAAAAERSVIFEPEAGAIEVTASPRSGVPPLLVNTNIAIPDGAQIVRYEIDHDGDGTPELITAERPTELTHTYEAPGQYAITIRYVRADGSTGVATTRVIVHSWAVMDGLLRATWNRFTGALARSDVDAAARELAASARERYEMVLRSASAALPAYTASLTGFDPVWIHDDAAHYLLRRLQDGRTFGYHVYFARDGEGVWRLVQF